MRAEKDNNSKIEDWTLFKKQQTKVNAVNVP